MEQQKGKRINTIKLESLSDEALKQRIAEGPMKIENKKKRYQSLHDLNLQRLKNYEVYRNDDLAACKKILAERQAKKALPAGKEKVAG